MMTAFACIVGLYVSGALVVVGSDLKHEWARMITVLFALYLGGASAVMVLMHFKP